MRRLLPGRAPARSLAAAGALALLATLPALADWLQPDPSYRDAQLELRMALRDTAGRGEDPARLDTLAVALLKLGRLDEARALFERVLAASPADEEARAGLGKLALFEDRLGAVESLLAGLPPANDRAMRDLFAARIRRGDWAGAAGIADAAGQPGRVALLEELAREGAYQLPAAPPERVEVPWARAFPVPLVKVRLNGEPVLMAISTGVARRTGVRSIAAETPVYWSGSQAAARAAIVQRLEIGGLRFEHVPAGTLPLRRYSLEVNPQGEGLAGVIGFSLLRRFTPTLDWKRKRLELRPAGAAGAAPQARRIAFQIWGESAVTVHGTIGGGRRMAMIVDTGIPDCGVGAPREVCDELGLKSGMVSRMIRNAGVWLQGTPWTAVSVPAVSVGTLARGRLDGWSGALDSGELWREGVRRDALLGGEFFKGLRVTFDWSARALVVEE
jgi:tetratricopeptide (TPR) repeat protein